MQTARNVFILFARQDDGRHILARRSMLGRQGSDESIHCPSFKLSGQTGVVTTLWLMTLSAGPACGAGAQLPRLSRVCHALHHDRAWSIVRECALQVYTIRSGQRSSHGRRSADVQLLASIEVVDSLALSGAFARTPWPMRYTCKSVNFRKRI